jgi:hypothetical protein
MLINKTECHKTLLARAEQRWPGKMTRVQNAVYEHLDLVVRREIFNFVSKHPTKGKTLMIATVKRNKETET